MAVTIPIIVAVYELLYRKLPLRSLRALTSWLKREGLFLAVSTVMTLAFLIGQATSAGSLLENTSYQPVFTWDRFMLTSRNFADDLFLQHVKFFISRGAVAVDGAVRSSLGIAISRAEVRLAFPDVQRFAGGVHRSGRAAVLYSAFGWALYAAIVLAKGSHFLLDRLTRGRASWLVNARAAALFVALGIVMFISYRGTGWPRVPFVSLEGEILRNVADQMRLVHPTVKPAARLLFINDPMGSNDLDMVFLAQMVYRDQTLRVNRTKGERSIDSKLIASSDYIFDYRSGRFFPSVQPRPQGPQPAIAFEWGQLGVFHQGWERVTAHSPAR